MDLPLYVFTVHEGGGGVKWCSALKNHLSSDKILLKLLYFMVGKMAINILRLESVYYILVQKLTD